MALGAGAADGRGLAVVTFALTFGAAGRFAAAGFFTAAGFFAAFFGTLFFFTGRFMPGTVPHAQSASQTGRPILTPFTAPA